MGGESYEQFRRELFARHETRANKVLSVIGDGLIVSGVVVALASRHPRWFARGLVVGLGVSITAHVLQPGSLGPEVVANVRHPLWALRAEAERVLGAA